MTRVAVRGRIDASPEAVFQVISDIDRLAKTSPDVIDITYLTEQRRGAGTRFRETRRSRNREMVSELEVAEFRENERSRIVTEVHGTVWDTLYSVREVAGGTELEICMDARPTALRQRLVIPLMKGFLRRVMQTHLEQVRSCCQRDLESTEPHDRRPEHG